MRLTSKELHYLSCSDRYDKPIKDHMPYFDDIRHIV